MRRRRWWPWPTAAALALVAGCTSSGGGRSSTTPSPVSTAVASSTTPSAVTRRYGVGNAFMPLLSGAVWNYLDVGASGANQHLTYQVTRTRSTPGGSTANVAVTTGSGNVSITYVVDSSHDVHVQLDAGSLSESGQGNFVFPASPLACTPCRYTASFTGSVPGFPPFTEKLTEVVTSLGTVALTDPENHESFSGTAHLHATIDVVPAAGGPPVTVSTIEEVYLAPSVGMVEDGNGTVSVTAAGNTHTSPTGTLWLASYSP
jgi:hypothetical protein